MTSKKSIQIVESYRRADKVSQKIVRHVGQAATDREVEEMTRLAQSIITEMEEEKQPALPLLDPLKVMQARRQSKEVSKTVKVGNLREEQRIIDGIGDVFGKLYKDLKPDTLISGRH